MAKHHKWGQASKLRLTSCDQRLIDLMDTALRLAPFDLTIVEGHRSNEKQQQLLDEGKSKLGPGKSKHNRFPSMAVDVAPIIDGKIPWQDRDPWMMLAGVVLAAAEMLDLDVIWGGDWDGDFDSAEHGFWDGPHWELVE